MFVPLQPIVHGPPQFPHPVDNQPVLLLAAALGAVVMASSRDFITMIVALELVSGPGFLLAGWRKADEKSNEAALKFFIIGVVAFALLVMGVSLLYGISGTQLFSELAVVPPSVADEPAFVLGMLFVFLGFAFKISAASVPSLYLKATPIRTVAARLRMRTRL